MLLLTRPMEESLRMAKKLERPFFVEPLLAISFMPPPSLENISTLIVTSQNGLRGLIPPLVTPAQAGAQGTKQDLATGKDSAVAIPPMLPWTPACAGVTRGGVYCVGESTRTLAKRMGFKNIHVAKHSVQSLLNLIRTKSPQELGEILYAAGETTTLDLEKILSPLGYEIKTEVVYKTTPLKKFSPALLGLLKDNKIRQVCFFSTKTAEVFMHLMDHHRLTSLYEKMEALSFSQHISNKLSQYPWGSIKTAIKPTMNSFWNIFKNQVE